ncbi:TPA: hypothetical protein ACJXXT_000209 [Pseudomonas aeruginosa]
MKVKDIDLKHFTIQLERVGSLINTTVIRIRSKPEYVDNYKDSHGEPIKLSFTLQTNMHLRFTEKTKKVILSVLPREEIYRLKDSIAYRLSNIIKERDIQLYSTQNELDVKEEISPKQTNDLNLSDDFDFDFEDDVLSNDFNKEETLVNAKHLNDEFDFSEFDDVITSNFKETLEQDKPVKARTIDEILASLVDSRQQLKVSYQAISKLLDEIKIVEENQKSIEATVDDLERELFNELQKKHK